LVSNKDRTAGVGSSLIEIQVFLEKLKGNGYRAGGAEPFAVTPQGATLQKALSKRREKIKTRLKKGTEIVTLEIGAQPHPWQEFAGMFKDDPWIEDWVQSMAEYRRQVEDDPNR